MNLERENKRVLLLLLLFPQTSFQLVYFSLVYASRTLAIDKDDMRYLGIYRNSPALIGAVRIFSGAVLQLRQQRR